MCGVLPIVPQDVVVRLVASCAVDYRACGVAFAHNCPMSAKPQNDSFLRACLRQPTEHTPVWLDAPGRPLPFGVLRDREAPAASWVWR